MKKIFFLLILAIFLGCSNDDQINNCFPNFSFNETITLSNPQFIDLQVPGGNTSITLSSRNLIVIRGNSNFKVFDLQCPEMDCNSVMTFDGLKLTCPCSGKEYSSLNGSSLDGEGCFALEYQTLLIGSNSLQITR